MANFMPLVNDELLIGHMKLLVNEGQFSFSDRNSIKILGRFPNACY